MVLYELKFEERDRDVVTHLKAIKTGVLSRVHAVRLARSNGSGLYRLTYNSKQRGYEFTINEEGKVGK